MNPTEKLDCVELKLDLQKRLLDKWNGLSDEKIRSQFECDMERSEDVLARWWRQVRARQGVSRSTGNGQ